ncbi:hypothetical protein XENOCAPTIV_000061 [Xenoophorus captivus]|uniref:Uncharacterized protein n=1 Tax=Xenoophorus captivus TaxID=1517983 RepID=A0ABV0Q734_9TELE
MRTLNRKQLGTSYQIKHLMISRRNVASLQQTWKTSVKTVMGLTSALGRLHNLQNYTISMGGFCASTSSFSVVVEEKTPSGPCSAYQWHERMPHTAEGATLHIKFTQGTAPCTYIGEGSQREPTVGFPLFTDHQNYETSK